MDPNEEKMSLRQHSIPELLEEERREPEGKLTDDVAVTGSLLKDVKVHGQEGCEMTTSGVDLGDYFEDFDSQEGKFGALKADSKIVKDKNEDEAMTPAFPTNAISKKMEGKAKACCSKSLKVQDSSAMTMTPEAFQELIKERKAEKKRRAEEKRLEGLRRIAEMNSKTGIHPLSLFPKEIWNMILEELKSPEDRVNMFQIHDTFQGLMEANLIRDVLFPLTLDYKITRKTHERGEHMRRLHLAPLMPLRQVSKSMRNAVDKQIEDHLLCLMRNGESPGLLNTIQFKLTDNQSKLEKLLAFSRGFPTVERPKRLFGRSLRVTFTPVFSDADMAMVMVVNLIAALQFELVHQHLVPAKFQVFKENITEMLEKVGYQILHFQLEFQGTQRLLRHGVPLSLSQIYDILREWLLLMPNLKWLVLKLADSEVVFTPNWLGKATLDLALKDLQVPAMNQLERVDLTGSIWKPVLRANPHVKYYQNPRTDFNDPTTLSLALETVEMKSACELPLFQMVSFNNSWNLTKMTLSINANDHEDIALDGVFRSLENFQTLEDLSFRIDGLAIGPELNFLLLPSLKNLQLSFGPNGKFLKYPEPLSFFFSLQFLLLCGKLEKLIWENLKLDSTAIHRCFDRRGESGGMIDFKGGFEDLSTSCVWDVLPDLKSVKVEFRVGARESGRQYFSREYRERKIVHESNKKW